MDKEVLVQYADMMEEIKDIRARIARIEKQISNIGIVSDSVKGTRRDGTYGSIKITGYPAPEYYKKKVLLNKNKNQLELKEIELLELTNQAEEYIDAIKKPEFRTMMRLFCIDSLSYPALANQMNYIFPKRKIKYTDENVRKRIQRFFEKV